METRKEREESENRQRRAMREEADKRRGEKGTAKGFYRLQREVGSAQREYEGTEEG